MLPQEDYTPHGAVELHNSQHHAQHNNPETEHHIIILFSSPPNEALTTGSLPHMSVPTHSKDCVNVANTQCCCIRSWTQHSLISLRRILSYTEFRLVGQFRFHYYPSSRHCSVSPVPRIRAEQQRSLLSIFCRDTYFPFIHFSKRLRELPPLFIQHRVLFPLGRIQPLIVSRTEGAMPSRTRVS